MGVRKIATLFTLLFVIVALIGVIMRMYHIPGGKITLVASCYGLIAGLVMFLFAPNKNAKNAMAPVMYRLTIVTRVTICLAGITMVTGMLFKFYHINGSRLLYSLGFVLYILYIVLIIFIRSGIKKQPLLNIPSIDVDPDVLNIYVGIYYNEQLKMHITVIKNDMSASLTAQATGQNAFPLKAIEKNVFNYDRAGIVMEFKPENGQFILIQNGGYYTFNKK